MSTDAINWSFHPVEHPCSSYGIRSTQFFPELGEFYTIGSTDPDANNNVELQIGKSTDGINWNFHSKVESLTKLGLNTFFDGAFCFIGNSGDKKPANSYL